MRVSHEATPCLVFAWFPHLPLRDIRNPPKLQVRFTLTAEKSVARPFGLGTFSPVAQSWQFAPQVVPNIAKQGRLSLNLNLKPARHS